MTTVYLSGPMTGYAEFNFPAFDSLTEFLLSAECGLALGITEVISPAEHDREVLWKEKRTVPVDVPGYAEGDAALYAESIGMIHDLLRWDFEMIMHEADAIVMLPGWKNSSGARSERLVAEATGKTVYLAHDHGTTAQYSQEGILLHREQHWAISTDLDQRRCHNELARAFAPRVDCPGCTGDPAEHPVRNVYPDGEVRIVNAVTGGAKGQKLARLDLLPPHVLVHVAEHFGRGAAKYEDRNWEKGYDWSLSYGAMLRHLLAWWGGEDNDPELGSNHLDAVLFHAMVLREFVATHPQLDDRPGRTRYSAPSEPQPRDANGALIPAPPDPNGSHALGSYARGGTPS